MKILSITAGAAGMYCGSCSRDNALAVELLARGHDVTLLPLYTPTNPDEANVSRNRVLFGGISIYLQQHVPLFRKLPRFLDRLWDSPGLIRAVAGRSISTDPRLLGVEAERIDVVPLGINMTGCERRQPRGGEFVVGYFARIAPEKGLHLLAEAYPLFRRRTGSARVRLDAAGYVSRPHQRYLADI